MRCFSEKGIATAKMFLSASSCTNPLDLGSQGDNLRTVYPLIFTSDIDFGVERVPINSAIPPHLHEEKDEVITVLKRQRIGEDWGG